ncbi:hypothetical protein EMCRGX_G007614 [Ephydatia muelleri]
MSLLFSDDTSGNNTKKWHKMELWNLMLAGLPRHINSRHENIHFLSCSDLVSSLEQSKPIAQQLILLETEGVVVYDSLYDEDVLVVVPLLCIVCDNPMASQLCNHLVGGTALMFCRICMAKRTVNPDVVCERRTRSSALQQIAEILAQPTERDKVEKRKEFGLNEHENPLLHIPVDMFQSTPVEVLHTMGLGAIKYLLEELMPKMNARQKKEILARLRAFNTSGMQVKLYGNVCQYYQSFLGRDFKAWAQMAIFIISPYLDEGQKAVLFCLSKLFQITYCEFYETDLSNEWQRVCQEFVDAIKIHMPHLLQRKKTMHKTKLQIYITIKIYRKHAFYVHFHNIRY